MLDDAQVEEARHGVVESEMSSDELIVRVSDLKDWKRKKEMQFHETLRSIRQLEELAS